MNKKDNYFKILNRIAIFLLILIICFFICLMIKLVFDPNSASSVNKAKDVENSLTDKNEPDTGILIPVQGDWQK